MELLLNTARMVDRDQNREFSIGDNNSLEDKLAIALMNREDFIKVKISQVANVRLSNQYGSVIVRLWQDNSIPKGTILMQVSIWSNQITGVEKGDIIYKNIKVEAEVTNDSILSFEKILATIKAKR